MKLKIGIVLIGVLLCNLTNVWTQLDNLNTKITLKQDTSLKAVLAKIEQMADVRFSYSEDHIDVEKRVKVNFKNMRIHDCLLDLGESHSFDFTIVEKQVILKRKVQNEMDDNIKPVPKRKIKDRYSVSGYIRDAQSMESMIGATVYIKELKTGTSANEYGYYVLSLPKGSYTLEFTFIGYKKESIQINLTGHMKLNKEISLDEELLQEVVVEASEVEDMVEMSQMSNLHIYSSEMNNMPKQLGESEAIKTLSHHPGIKVHGDGSTYYYVRGGNKDQNLILLDEAPIYIPSHLFGFFSSITSDAIRDLQVYKGDLPIRHGGVLSSIVDIHAKEGDLSDFHMNGSFNQVATRLAIEGPFVKEKVSYYLSLRKSHLKWLLPRTSRNSTNLEFSDLHTKLNYIVNPKNRLYLTFYAGSDDIGGVGGSLGAFGLNWNNSTLSFRWNHVFGPRLFSNTTLYASTYNYFLYTNRQRSEYWSQKITNASLKSDYTFYSDPNNIVNFGFHFKGHFFDPGNLVLNDSNIQVPFIHQRNNGHRVLYLAHDHKFNSRLSFRYGIRLNTWDNAGPTTIYDFNDRYQVVDTNVYTGTGIFNRQRNLEPRINMTLKVDSLSSLKASYNHNVQYIQLLSNSSSPFTSLAVWMPSDPNIPAQELDQFALGYYRTLGKTKLEFSSEVYYKKMYNQIDYADHASLLLNPKLQGELRFGTGTAYGLELLLRKKLGKWNGWLGYNYGRVFMQVNEVNRGEQYPAYQDRPHQISFNLSYNVSERWNLSTSWIYMSGAAITTPTGFYYYQGKQVPYYAKRNNDRLPAYHRLDLCSTWKLNKDLAKRYQHNLVLSIYNAYGRNNPAFLHFNKVLDGSGYIIPTDIISEQEIVPTQLAFLGFIPTLTYNFKF